MVNGGIVGNLKRSTTTRDLHRSIIRRREDPCGICGGAIDYDLPHLHPGQFVVDHIVPYSKGGPDTLENKQAAHRVCNRAKSDRLPGAEEGGRAVLPPLVTARRWW